MGNLPVRSDYMVPSIVFAKAAKQKTSNGVVLFGIGVISMLTLMVCLSFDFMLILCFLVPCACVLLLWLLKWVDVCGKLLWLDLGSQTVGCSVYHIPYF